MSGPPLAGLARAVQSCAKSDCNKRGMVEQDGRIWCPDCALELVKRKRR